MINPTECVTCGSYGIVKRHPEYMFYLHLQLPEETCFVYAYFATLLKLDAFHSGRNDDVHLKYCGVCIGIGMPILRVHDVICAIAY